MKGNHTKDLKAYISWDDEYGSFYSSSSSLNDNESSNPCLMAHKFILQSIVKRF